MASKRRHKRKQCVGKVAYADQSAAVRQANLLNRKAASPIDAYRCQVCGDFHVGHRPKKVDQEIVRRRRQAIQ